MVTSSLLHIVTIISHLLQDQIVSKPLGFSGCARPNSVQVCRQIWPLSATLDFSRYRISSITSGRILSKLRIWIFLNLLCIFLKMIPVCQLIWPPHGHFRNCNFPFTSHCINTPPHPYPDSPLPLITPTLPLSLLLSLFLPYPTLLCWPILAL